MPRPRIRPENRQRAVKACIPCKTSKKRCDSKAPCAACVRRNCVFACLYSEVRQPMGRTSHSTPNPNPGLHPEAFTAYPTPRPGLHQLFETPLVVAPELGATMDESQTDESPADESQIDDDPGDELPMGEDETDQVSVKVDSLPRSRLMLNTKGEKVYVGNAAALAFLQFLRQILSQHMGPSHFTENRRGNVMLEAQFPGENLPDFEEDVETKRVLIDNYFLASSGILDLYTRSEMDELLASADSPNRDGNIHEGPVYLALAIGGQCRASSPLNLQYSRKYFTRGQQAAFEGMLEDPSIKLIHSFLLMAFYLLGACRRNAAFMYLGVAARAAHALGLHEADQYRPLNAAEQSLRLRTWKSLRILDVMVGSILARPLASISTRPDTFISTINKQDHTFSTTAMNSNFEMCSMIEDVLQHINQQTHLDAASTENLLQRLSQWSANLPPEIRLCSIRTSVLSSEHEQVVGSIHVACVYYFTVMLLTRPFLIRYLMSRLPNLPDNHADIGSNPEPSDLSKLAQVSIDAATFMAHICHNALSADLLLDNMCILKAWVFAAGLVLGFTMFANVEISPELENAFTRVRDVLKKLSYQSPQAEHYHDVLSSFSEAIVKRREQIAQERRRATSQYLDQILVIDFRDNQDRQYIVPTSRNSELSRFEADSLENWWNSEFPSSPGILDHPPDVLTANWDTFALQISENFTIDNDPSARLSDAV